MVSALTAWLAGDYSGVSVAGAGDVNGDGFADVMIGAIFAGPPPSAGSSYVIYGRAPDAQVTRIGSAAGQYISGGAFADNLFGHDGNDTLEGRGGTDRLDGGFGADTAFYAHAASGLTVNLAAPNGNTGDAAADKYNSVENLTGSKFADTLTGNGLANAITGLAGADTLLGAGGADRLIGGPGKDAMNGGPGSDIFVFDKLSESGASAARDTIADFNAGRRAPRSTASICARSTPGPGRAIRPLRSVPSTAPRGGCGPGWRAPPPSSRAM